MVDWLSFVDGSILDGWGGGGWRHSILHLILSYIYQYLDPAGLLEFSYEDRELFKRDFYK